MLSIPTIEITYVADDDINFHISTVNQTENKQTMENGLSSLLVNNDKQHLTSSACVMKSVATVKGVISELINSDEITRTDADKLNENGLNVNGEDIHIPSNLRRSKRRRISPSYLSKEFERDRKNVDKSTVATTMKNECVSNGIDLANEISENIPDFTQDVVLKLETYYGKYFHRWLNLMREGNNIVLYGIGSKRILLETFRKRYLKNEYHIVIEGYIENISFTSIVGNIASLMFNVTTKDYHQVSDLLCMITKYNTAIRNLFLIVHNIDGPALRNDTIQKFFVQLASTSKVHMLVSADELNISSMCIDYNAKKCKWLWYKTSTWRSYIVETTLKSASGGLYNGSKLNSNFINNVVNDLSNRTRTILTLLLDHWKCIADKMLPYRGIDMSTLLDLAKSNVPAFVSKPIVRHHVVELKNFEFLSLNHHDIVKLTLDNRILHQLWTRLHTI